MYASNPKKVGVLICKCLKSVGIKVTISDNACALIGVIVIVSCVLVLVSIFVLLLYKEEQGG